MIFAHNKRLIVAACLLVAVAQPVAAASWWERLLGIGTEDAPAEDASAGALGKLDISGGLREALIVGSDRVVAQLAKADGFNLDPAVRIQLPQQLTTAREWLDRVGMAGPIDELEVRMNRAAEAATPKAKALFVDAIKSMTIEDARGLLDGGATAATDFLRGKMAEPLVADMRPVIDNSLKDVGAVSLLDNAMAQYGELPFAPPIEFDLRDYVANKTVDGIFTYLAKEEQAIREDPAKRTTELLRSVFTQ